MRERRDDETATTRATAVAESAASSSGPSVSARSHDSPSIHCSLRPRPRRPSLTAPFFASLWRGPSVFGERRASTHRHTLSADACLTAAIPLTTLFVSTVCGDLILDELWFPLT